MSSKYHIHVTAQEFTLKYLAAYNAQHIGLKNNIKSIKKQIYTILALYLKHLFNITLFYHFFKFYTFPRQWWSQCHYSANRYLVLSELVSWSLTSLFSTNMAISETIVLSEANFEKR